MLNQLGRTQEAIAAAQEALRHRTEPRHDALAYYNLGNSYFKLGQQAKAAGYFKQAIAGFALTPKLGADEYFYLGNSYLQTEQTEPAVRAFRDAIKLRPNFSQPYLSLGAAYMTLGNRRAALEIYESLKTIDAARGARLLKVINAK